MRNYIAKGSLVLLLLFFETGYSYASEVKVKKFPDGWRLMVDGQPYFVKGVCYSIDTVGETPGNNTLRDWMWIDEDKDGRNDIAYQSWVDKNRNNTQDEDEKPVGDFQLLKDLGVNTIRLYHHASGKPEIHQLTIPHNSTVFSHPPNKQLLRELYENYGIRVMLGDLLGSYVVGSGVTWDEGTDYRDPIQQERMMKSVEEMIIEFKDEPFILLWALGNENNLKEATHTNAKDFPEAYARFVNRVAQRIHELDPHHPVVLVNGDTLLVEVYGKLAPDVDIFGLNSYRGSRGFDTLWKEVEARYGKPVLLTEYGTGYPPVVDGVLNENLQAKAHKNNWQDIVDHQAGGKIPQNAIGGFVYNWMDDWWQSGNPQQHDLAPNGWHYEFNGLISQGNGQHSPLMRQLRKVYFMYQSIFRN